MISCFASIHYLKPALARLEYQSFAVMQGTGVESGGNPSCSQEVLWTLEKQRKWFVYLALSLQQCSAVKH